MSETLSQADREIVNGKAVIICELEPYLVGLFLFFFKYLINKTIVNCLLTQPSWSRYLNPLKTVLGFKGSG